MNKSRPTDAEFEELKRKRDEALEAAISAICAKYGWARENAHVHVSGAGECYCACPGGPCQHIWDGPEYREDNCSSATCSRCGTIAMYHDMRFGP